jgi:hypothetical protein
MTDKHPGRKPIHGHSRRGAPSGTYNSWRGMLDRCRPENAYGALGIAVCERWHLFAHFLSDMGERPDGHEIDRANVLGHYEPGNCSWLPVRENRQNRRTTKLTPDLMTRVVELRRAGCSQRAIALDLGVAKNTIWKFLNGKSWYQHGWMVGGMSDAEAEKEVNGLNPETGLPR